MMPGLSRRKRADLLAVIQTAGGCYAALSAGDPGDNAATKNEPALGVNGYTRQPITWASIFYPFSGAPAYLRSAADVVWTSTGPWIAQLAISHVAIFTSDISSGESFFVGSCGLTPAKLVDRAGIVITVPASALYLSIGLED